MEGKSSVLNRLFTQSSIKEILYNISEFGLSDIYYSAIKRYVTDPSSKCNGEIISEIYSYIRKNYRNEYFYKNTLLNKLLIKEHNPLNTTALTEVPIGKSKADFILINGRAVVYEIKTALDTFERLPSQLEDYYKAFDYVAVLTDENNCDTLVKMLQNSPVGIYKLTKRDSIQPIKKPESYVDSLDLQYIFNVLNKEEFERILLECFGYLPQTTDARYYGECRKMFCSMELEVAYKKFKEVLKRRNKIIVEEFSDVPYELKSAVYFSKFKKDDYIKLKYFLQKSFCER